MEKYLLFLIATELAWVIGLLIKAELYAKTLIKIPPKPTFKPKDKPIPPTAEEIKYKTILDNIDNYGTSKPQTKVR